MSTPTMINCQLSTSKCMLFSNATLWKFAPLGWNTGHYDQLQRERINILFLGRKMSRESH